MNHSPEYKSELRRLVKDWNTLHKTKQNKVKVKLNNTLPYIQTCVHKNLNVNSLLDTGAGKNFITHSLFKQLKKLKVIKSLETWNGKMLAANDTQINVLGKCKFKIKIGTYTWKEEFLVMQNNVFDMILGTPFIVNKGLILDLEKKNIILNSNHRIR
jgi:hypothetical protein